MGLAGIFDARYNQQASLTKYHILIESYTPEVDRLQLPMDAAQLSH